ncbi:hypothetical protein EBI01_19750 [Marinomonas rhizomae]|uniref:Uncharacterized protein n=1 Tax=Marinomonas rhizomae TaxID=491948 RepID=A0A366ISZ2_9GAMM|nr:hypothetical protein [Marinomonas rhizomae]RBP77911.1 hypothetical protein DFP80_1242 [Marinomonas rhizomae]RNF68890.1 hypothetical protein EBI01_19750 [Marinomonas rhizomae]
MDIAVKIFQIIFYLTASVVAVLTFIKAKNGLLNSVNTEYQKKVMERLASLADELWEEFDFVSENHWSKDGALTEVLEKIHEYALQNKYEILTGKKGFFGVPLPKKQKEMMAMVEKLKTDPFIPEKIRNKIVSLLDERLNSTFDAYQVVIGEYQKELSAGRKWNTFEENKSFISNDIVSIMSDKGLSIPKLQEAIHEIRLEIQKYYESFNTIKN